MGDIETEIDKLFTVVNKMDKLTKSNGEYNIFSNDDKIADKIKGYNEITRTTVYQTKEHYKDDNVYTEAFKTYIDKINENIKNAKNDILKYVNIGKVFRNFHCNKNDFRTRLRSHIINMHKVRIWNKKILMLKLQQLLKEITIEIGDCNDSFFGRNKMERPVEQIKNVASQLPSKFVPESVQKSFRKVIRMASHKEGIQAPSEELVTPEPIPKEESKEISIINNVRSQTSLLFRMFEAKVVSDKEYKYVEKIDPTHWVTNPAIMASLTAVISNAAFYSGVTDELTKAGVANSLISSASPLLALLVASIGTAITKTSAYQELALNKKILLDFSKLKDKFKTQYNIKQKVCPDTDNKESMFKKVMTKIEAFYAECDEHYNEILDMCIDYAGVYDVICAEPLEVTAVDNGEVDEKASDTEIENMVVKIRKCNATGLNDIKKLTDDELRDKLRRLTKKQISKIRCTETGKSIVQTLKMPSSSSQSHSKTASSKTKTKSKTNTNKTRSKSR